jgi:4-hydroxybenzoate polyprenyltransferase
VLSTSASELVAYARERLCVWRIGALWLLVTALCYAASPSLASREAVVVALLAALLITQFRLWDDIADRDHDRSVHPERVLVNTVFPGVYRLAVVIATMPIAGLIATGAAPAIRLAAYALLCLATALIYRAGAGTTWRNQLVLLKYPVFVLLCVAQVSVKAMLAAAAVYLTVSVYDWKTTKRGMP